MYSIWDCQYDKSPKHRRARLIFTMELIRETNNKINDILMNSNNIQVIQGRENLFDDTYEFLIESQHLPPMEEGLEAPVWCLGYSTNFPDEYYISRDPNSYPRIIISNL